MTRAILSDGYLPRTLCRPDPTRREGSDERIRSKMSTAAGLSRKPSCHRVNSASVSTVDLGLDGTETATYSMQFRYVKNLRVGSRATLGDARTRGIALGRGIGIPWCRVEDLGQRLTERRKALRLSVSETARRADI